MAHYEIDIPNNTPELYLTDGDTLTVKFSGTFIFEVSDPGEFDPPIIPFAYGPGKPINTTVVGEPEDLTYSWFAFGNSGQRTIHVSSSGPLALLEDEEVRSLFYQTWPSAKILGHAILRSKHFPLADSSKKILELTLRAGDNIYQKAYGEAGKENSE